MFQSIQRAADLQKSLAVKLMTVLQSFDQHAFVACGTGFRCQNLASPSGVVTRLDCGFDRPVEPGTLCATDGTICQAAYLRRRSLTLRSTARFYSSSRG